LDSIGTVESYEAIAMIGLKKKPVADKAIDIINASDCQDKGRLIHCIASTHSHVENKAIDIFKKSLDNIPLIVELGQKRFTVARKAIDALKEIGTEGAILGIGVIAETHDIYIAEAMPAIIESDIDTDKKEKAVGSLSEAFSGAIQAHCPFMSSDMNRREKNNIADKKMLPFKEAVSADLMTSVSYDKLEATVRRAIGIEQP
jgi:hypothetical protein